MGISISSHASVFEKVLAAYEAGGITFTDVLSQLRRLIAADVQPLELLEILRRRELVEPLPEPAHRQVYSLLTEAMGRAEAPEDAPSAAGDGARLRDDTLSHLQKLLAERELELQAARSRASELDSNLATARTALTAQQNSAIEARKALVDSAAVLEDERSQSRQALRRLESLTSELSALGEVHSALQREYDTLKAAHATLQQQHAESSRLAAQVGVSNDLIAALQAQLKQNDELRQSEQLQQTGQLQQTEPLRHSEPPPQSEPLHLSEPPLQSEPLHQSEPQLARIPGRTPLSLRSPMPRLAFGLFAVIGGAAVLVWFLFHPAPVPPRAPTTVVAGIPEAGNTIRDCPTCPSVTVLALGRFKQGSARGESAAGAAEKPLHWVLIARPFGMTTNLITVDEFKRFVTATRRNMEGCDIYDAGWHHSPQSSWANPGFEQGGLHPVTCVSWNDAQAYAQWLSTTSGQRYRLPSASEWEYAARAGGEASQPWAGDGADACSNANVADKSAARRYPGWATFGCDDGFVNTSPVGSFKANAFGLNDMLGNVFQWTQDCWYADYSGAPIDGSARQDGDCAQREMRGGSWFSSPSYVRANYRNHFGIDYRTSSVGFRLVRDFDR